MKISYGITVCNEETELQKLVIFLLKHKELQDEIVITYDSKNGSKSTEEYLKSNIGFSWHTFEFSGNFSDLKNHTILEMNSVDLIWIPRVNTVDGMTQEHIQKWGWKVSEKGWVNFPDYQARVFLNSPEVKWTRKVHEHITGHTTQAHLPPHEELSLYHPKTIKKQEKQNELYEKIQTT